MSKFSRRKNIDILEATLVTVRAIRNSADGFPPLKSVAGAVIVIWGMILAGEALSTLLPDADWI
jgi:hypothetical protein